MCCICFGFCNFLNEPSYSQLYSSGLADPSKRSIGSQQVGEQSYKGYSAFTFGTMPSHPLHKPGKAKCHAFLS